ncbi:hypothetical protein GCM10010842_29260 [Deinococcus daejeonensis]|uniref:Uncharacterized protein n=1 Tax=Deinococcus daejeonensis TaxID=1007098 RepID=A0ABQ2JCQ1_9DEIO|nr:hypothetical protein GCM10010842_29260 [Deinococcus daejeonensis]
MSIFPQYVPPDGREWMFEDQSAEQQGDQQGVTQFLVRTPLEITEIPFGPAVKLTDDGSSA